MLNHHSLTHSLLGRHVRSSRWSKVRATVSALIYQYRPSGSKVMILQSQKTTQFQEVASKRPSSFIYCQYHRFDGISSPQHILIKKIKSRKSDLYISDKLVVVHLYIVTDGLLYMIMYFGRNGDYKWSFKLKVKICNIFKNCRCMILWIHIIIYQDTLLINAREPSASSLNT